MRRLRWRRRVDGDQPRALPERAPTRSEDDMTAPPDIRTAPSIIRTPRPDVDPERSSAVHRALVGIFVAVPLVALVAAVPFAWGWGLGWHDIVLALGFYVVSRLGISAGFHRYFTHASFKAKRPLRLALAVAGSLAFP